jgi:hypothetical protein
MSERSQGGERRQPAPQSTGSERCRNTRISFADASFAWSFDPCTSILAMHPGRKPRVAGRSTRHHGWASPRKWDGTSTGVERTDVARLAACHSLLRREGVARREKEGDQGLRPCEDQESGSGCPHIDGTLQKSVGDGWSRISSANALQKERSGSSERGPSSERGSAGDTVGSRIERNARRTSASPRKSGEDRHRPRVARDRHLAVVTSPKAVRRSRDRGCKGHRILRRVPTGGRHPGSSRSVGFHETTRTMVSAASPPSDPCQTSSSKRGDRTRGQVAAGAKAPEARG